MERTWVPGARDRWSRASGRTPLHVEPEPVADVLGWLDGRVSADFDPATGLGWQLSFARTTDGGAVLSLVAAHAIADGAALLDAVTRADGGTPAPVTEPSGPLAAILDDLADARKQLSAAARWVLNRPRGTKKTPPPAKTSPQAPADWRVPHVVVECDSADLARTAAARGGSVNSLFVAALSRVAATAGCADAVVPAALPVSGREPDDARANSTRIAVAGLDRSVLDEQDLAEVKAECKRAYQRLAAASPGSQPLALLQMLPDTVVRRLPPPPAATVLASNVGRLPGELCGAPVRSVSATAHYPGAGPEEVATIGDGVTGWLSDSGERSTISVCGLAPGRINDVEELRELVVSEFAAWGVAVRPW
ncbi:hypothetical protein [Saccharopolyspora flava]|uniref:hypothetical protein n=1 Tax=Saccharopolyspora flava TaxID=95161 RepID=UPI000B8394C1|nr:hypothetical protein [Saccharopolyspora flava]